MSADGTRDASDELACLRLPGTHDWRVAHAIAAHALERGIQVEFG